MNPNPIISFDLFSNKSIYIFENKYILNDFINFTKNNIDNDVKILNNKIIINDDNNNNYFNILKKWKISNTNIQN